MDADFEILYLAQILGKLRTYVLCVQVQITAQTRLLVLTVYYTGFMAQIYIISFYVYDMMICLIVYEADNLEYLEC